MVPLGIEPDVEPPGPPRAQRLLEVGVHGQELRRAGIIVYVDGSDPPGSLAHYHPDIALGKSAAILGVRHVLERYFRPVHPFAPLYARGPGHQ